MRESKSVFLKKLFVKARRRFRSREDYRAFQALQAERVYGDLESVFDLTEIVSIIDLGCGKGGYSDCLSKYFRKVWAVDLGPLPDNLKSTPIEYISADVLEYRSDQKVGLVFCASVIEHVNAPERLLDTINENLKINGLLYLSFPPFYSINGGHNAKPFHYLPEKIAIRISRKLGRVGKKVTSYANMFGKWGLYKRNIEDVWDLLEQKGFRIIKCKPRYFDRNIRKGAFLSNFLTWHVEFYCEKTA